MSKEQQARFFSLKIWWINFKIFKVLLLAIYCSTEFVKLKAATSQLYFHTLNSWWIYWKEPNDYQKKLGLSVVPQQLVKLFFIDLSNEYGKNQNANKSISNIIYTKCPQNIYIQLNDLEIEGVLSILLKVLKDECYM